MLRTSQLLGKIMYGDSPQPTWTPAPTSVRAKKSNTVRKQLATDTILDFEVVAVDADYKTPGVVREIFLSGKQPAVPYTRPKTKKQCSQTF